MENFVKCPPSSNPHRGCVVPTFIIVCFILETAFMAFADSVKIIGGGTGLSAFTQDIMDVLSRMLAPSRPPLQPRYEILLAQEILLNSSSIVPNDQPVLYHWRSIRPDWGWFSGDTAVVAFRYNFYSAGVHGGNEWLLLRFHCNGSSHRGGCGPENHFAAGSQRTQLRSRSR